HRGLLTFSRPRAGGIEAYGDDDFKGEGVAARLALAARSSASFPGAFEPSFIPVGESPDADHPDMAGAADFATTRFAMDGGVLVNRPIGPAMRAVFEQKAVDRPVRRVLAYVVPDTGPAPGDTADSPGKPPPLLEVLGKVMTLPHVESVANDVEEIQRRSRAARGQAELREQLLTETSESDMDSLVERLFPMYRDLRAREVVGRIRESVDRAQAERHGLRDEVWGLLERLVRQQGAAGAGSPWLPTEPPSAASAGTDEWLWGVGALENAATITLSLVKRAMDADPKREHVAARPQLAGDRSRLHEVLTGIAVLRKLEGSYWRDVAASLLRTLDGSGDRATLIGRWVSEPHPTFTTWLAGRVPAPGPEAFLEPAVTGRVIAQIVLDAGPSIRSIFEPAGPPPSGPPGAEVPTPLERRRALTPVVVDRLTSYRPGRAQLPDTEVARRPERPPDGTSVEGAVGATLCRLLQAGILTYTFAVGMPTLEQEVEFRLFSAKTPNGFDERSDPFEKVAGLQLAHFGGFYKRSWRANDWTWGRMDGAQKLVEVLLDPRRLLQVVPNAQAAQEAIKTIALSDDPKSRSVLVPRWERDEPAIAAELAALWDPARPSPPVLVASATAVARRIQLDFLRDELLSVGREIKGDLGEGAFLSSDARSFLRALLDAVTPAGSVAPADPSQSSGDQDTTGDSSDIGYLRRASLGSGSLRLEAEDVPDLFRLCRVGGERVTDEAGSDLFTKTVSQAALVGVSVASGPGRTLHLLRPFFATLRGVAMALYVFLRSMLTPSRTAFALMATLLILGGAILAAPLLTGATPAPVLLGIAALLVIAGVLRAAQIAGAPRAVAPVLATALLALIAYAGLMTAGDRSGRTGDFLKGAAPIVAGAIVIAGAAFLSVVRRAQGFRPYVWWGVLVSLAVAAVLLAGWRALETAAPGWWLTLVAMVGCGAVAGTLAVGRFIRRSQTSPAAAGGETNPSAAGPGGRG
ncbi:MAG TPA: DUF3376 domain-containing protein, partial [Actinomycetota bacterium]